MDRNGIWNAKSQTLLPITGNEWQGVPKTVVSFSGEKNSYTSTLTKNLYIYHYIDNMDSYNYLLGSSEPLNMSSNTLSDFRTEFPAYSTVNYVYYYLIYIPDMTNLNTARYIYKSMTSPTNIAKWSTSWSTYDTIPLIKTPTSASISRSDVAASHQSSYGGFNSYLKTLYGVFPFCFKTDKSGLCCMEIGMANALAAFGLTIHLPENATSLPHWIYQYGLSVDTYISDQSVNLQIVTAQSGNVISATNYISTLFSASSPMMYEYQHSPGAAQQTYTLGARNPSDSSTYAKYIGAPAPPTNMSIFFFVPKDKVYYIHRQINWGVSHMYGDFYFLHVGSSGALIKIKASIY